MTRQTEIEQHEQFLEAFNKAKKLKIAYTLEMQKDVFKSYLHKAIDSKPEKPEWVIDETLKIDGHDIAFAVEGRFFIEEKRWDVICKNIVDKVSIIDSENNEYSFELITEDDDFNFNVHDVADEVAQEYSVFYTEGLKIKKTDR